MLPGEGSASCWPHLLRRSRLGCRRPFRRSFRSTPGDAGAGTVGGSTTARHRLRTGRPLPRSPLCSPIVSVVTMPSGSGMSTTSTARSATATTASTASDDGWPTATATSPRSTTHGVPACGETRSTTGRRSSSRPSSTPWTNAVLAGALVAEPEHRPRSRPVLLVGPAGLLPQREGGPAYSHTRCPGDDELPRSRTGCRLARVVEAPRPRRLGLVPADRRPLGTPGVRSRPRQRVRTTSRLLGHGGVARPGQLARAGSAKRPGRVRLEALQAVAHGSRGMLYFQIRQARPGRTEPFGDDSSARPPRHTYRGRAAPAERRPSRHRVVVEDRRLDATIALVFDWPSWWGHHNTPGPRPAVALLRDGPRDLSRARRAWVGRRRHRCRWTVLRL